MASNGGVQTKIAILGSYGGSNRPIIGMSYVLINNGHLGPKVKNLSTSRHAEYPHSFILLQGHKERVRYAAVRCSFDFTYAVLSPTLYCNRTSTRGAVDCTST